MIDIKVNKGETKVYLDGDLKDIKAEFLILTREVYKGVKESGGEIPALFFKNDILSNIDVCFETDADIIKRTRHAEDNEHDAREDIQKLIAGIEEIIEMFPKEGKE